VENQSQKEKWQTAALSMNVLVIAPHPDDEAIGCGGTLRLRTKRGERVAAVFLTSGELGLKKLSRQKAWEVREQEARRAAKILGIAQLFFLRQPDWMLGENVKNAAAALRRILEQEKPRVIFLPHPKDNHPDHQSAFTVLKLALRESVRSKPELWGYEVWSPLETVDQVVDISAVMPIKIRAIRAHRSQLKEFDYVKAVRGLNQFRGELMGKCRFAEVFASLR
jgi:LmbE family N-acetylglucosaminyl deacetylase